VHLTVGFVEGPQPVASFVAGKPIIMLSPQKRGCLVLCVTVAFLVCNFGSFPRNHCTEIMMPIYH